MIIPQLSPPAREREYKDRSFDEVVEIVNTWLFKDDVSHRDMDQAILRLDPSYTKGYQSMGVLHHLGLKKQFKGLFKDVDKVDAIKLLMDDEQDFQFICELIEGDSPQSEQLVIEDLLEVGKRKDVDFVQNFERCLSELESTDRHGGKTYSRKEQGLLRGILFGGVTESKCAICHRLLSTDLLVAAHIKPRKKCSTSERKNPNIVMPACRLGCDELFEKGYVLVDAKGVIHRNSNVEISSDLSEFISTLEGKDCLYFNDETEKFFAYKYESETP